jgi:integrase
VKRFFTTKTERDREAAALEKKFTTWGAMGSVEIPRQEVEDYQTARKTLPPGVTLTAAAVFYVRHHNPLAPTLPDLITQFIALKRREGLNTYWVGQLERVLVRLAASIPEGTKVDVVTPEQIQAFLDSTGFKPETVATFRRIIHNAFQFALRKRWITANPVKVVTAPKVYRPTPKFVQPDDWGKLLATAVATDPGFVRFLVLQGFAGIRYFEVARMLDSDVDVENRVIRLPGFREVPGRAHPVRVTKSGKPRVLEAILDADKVDRGAGLPPVIWKWLKEFPKLDLKDHFRRRRAIVRKAGIAFPKNVLRHTFTTYHVALNGSAERTIILQGWEESSAVIWNHYRAIATRSQAEEFFSWDPAKVRRRFRTILNASSPA